MDKSFLSLWNPPNPKNCHYIPVPNNRPPFSWEKRTMIEPSSLNGKVAVFTTVRDENVFLPAWLRHYMKHFDAEDIYVLDNESNDGSTLGLPVTVVPVKSDGPWKHEWLRDTARSFQNLLLQNGYDAVLFAESDEFVFPDPDKFPSFSSYLGGFLASEHTHFRCDGYEVIHDYSNESRLDWSKPILVQRKYWSPTTLYSKAVLSKIPLPWRNGFHDLEGIPNIPVESGLFMVHMHFADFDTTDERNRFRNYRIHGDELKKEIDQRFRVTSGIKIGPVCPIPDRLKIAF